MDEIKDNFSVFDKDGSGMLRIAELRHVMTKIGDPMNREDMDAFIESVDRHGDGYVRLEDLIDMFEPQTDRGSLLAKKAN